MNIKDHIDLLLTSDIRNSHYLLFIGFCRLMTKKTKHHDESILVDIVYNTLALQIY